MMEEGEGEIRKRYRMGLPIPILGAFRGNHPEAILQIKFLPRGEGDLARALAVTRMSFSAMRTSALKRERVSFFQNTRTSRSLEFPVADFRSRRGGREMRLASSCRARTEANIWRGGAGPRWP